MIEEDVLNWEKILTILLGIVIVGSIYLILRARGKSKRKRIEREANLRKSDKQMHDVGK